MRKPLIDIWRRDKFRVHLHAVLVFYRKPKDMNRVLLCRIFEGLLAASDTVKYYRRHIVRFYLESVNDLYHCGIDTSPRRIR